MSSVCSAVPQEAQMGSCWPGCVDKPFPQFPSWCLPQSSGFSSRLMPPRETSASKPSTGSQVRHLTQLLAEIREGSQSFLKKAQEGRSDPGEPGRVLLIVIVDVDHCHDADCGGLQTGGGGLLSSPSYPESYPSPSRCAWLLEAPAGHTITVRLRPGRQDFF